MSANAPRAVLVCALVAFGAAQWWMSERIGTWSEEVSTYPQGAARALVPRRDGALAEESCEGATRLRMGTDRPVLALCAGGRTWPILGATYFSTWPTWTLAAPLPSDVFVLRKLGLVLGALTLLLAFAATSRLADRGVAAAGVACAALSSPFVIPHAVLIHFEVLQLPLVAVAAWLALRAPKDGLRVPDAVRLGLVAGLAVAVNVKALLLFAPLVLLAWRTRRLPSFRPGADVAAVLAALVPLAPMLGFEMFAPESGVSGQLGMRLHNVAARLSTGSALLEPLNCLRFWTDLAGYGDEAAGRTSAASWATLLVPAASLVHVTTHFVRALARRSHDALAATLGALLASYVVVAALLWDQRPPANYAPLHVVFGLATGTSLVAAAGWAQRRASLSPRAGVALAVVLVALGAGGLAWNTFRRGDPARLDLATNAVAQRVVVAYLAAHPGGTVATATYDLGGVPDEVGGGRIASVRLRPALRTCVEAHPQDDAARACLEARLRAAVALLGRLRLVLPASRALNDERTVALLVPALRALDARGDVHAAREASFRGVATRPVLEVWDVRPR